MKRWFKRKAPRAATAMTNPDNLVRTFAMIQGATILAAPAAVDSAAAWERGERNITFASSMLKAVKETPSTLYFKAFVPSIAAEGGIGTRKLVKKGLSKAFGLFK